MASPNVVERLGISDDPDSIPVPRVYLREIRKFLLDMQSGNLVLNVKNGRVLGLKMETYIRSD